MRDLWWSSLGISEFGSPGMLVGYLQLQVSLIYRHNDCVVLLTTMKHSEQIFVLFMYTCSPGETCLADGNGM